LLSTSPVAGKPAWSPDSARIAYVASNSASLVIVEATSGAEIVDAPVVNDGAAREDPALVSVGGPSWNPDGSKLAFICWDGQGDEVCVIDADGTNRRQVTHIEPMRRSTTSSASATPAGSNVGPPVWSPDGSSLAVPAYAEARGSAAGIYVVFLDQGIAKRVTAVQPTSDVLWTLDGGSLLFAASADGRSDVYRVPAAGGLARNLTQALSDGARDPALSPDGRQLAVASGRNIQILGPQARTIGSRDGSMRDRYPVWSPDGDELAFASSPALVTKYD
jgi:TolB protein